MPLCRELPFAICACGMPFVPDDPDESHPQHYLCQEHRSVQDLQRFSVAEHKPKGEQK